MGGAYFYFELLHLCPYGGSIHPLILIWWVPSHAPDLISGFISSKDFFLSPNQKLCPSPTIALCHFTLLIKFISLTAMHGYLLPVSPYQVGIFSCPSLYFQCLAQGLACSGCSIHCQFNSCGGKRGDAE